jgi:hypothetical protein
MKQSIGKSTDSGGSHDYDAIKTVKGHKRYIVIDTCELLIKSLESS